MKLLNWLLLFGRKPKGAAPMIPRATPSRPVMRAHGAPLRPSYPPPKADSYLPPSAPATTKSTD